MWKIFEKYDMFGKRCKNNDKERERERENDSSSNNSQ